MSFLKCCVGADPRPPPEAIRPVSSNPNRRNHGQGGSSLRPDSFGGNKKFKMPNEVFFDPSKPNEQLSSVTDQGNSGKDYSDLKKKKDGKDKSGFGRDGGKNGVVDEKSELDLPDNNGLTRGQNFMKVEKWLRNAGMHTQIDITPGVITNIEDFPVDLPENADPPSEKDRLPPTLASQQQSSRAR